jgi:hypothetical protein
MRVSFFEPAPEHFYSPCPRCQKSLKQYIKEISLKEPKPLNEEIDDNWLIKQSRKAEARLRAMDPKDLSPAGRLLMSTPPNEEINQFCVKCACDFYEGNAVGHLKPHSWVTRD